MKQYESLEDALTSLDKAPVKKLKDGDATKPKKKYFGNSDTNPAKNDLKGRNFFFNSVQYTIKTITPDNMVVTLEGSEFRLDDLINNGVKFTEPTKKVNFIKATTNSTGEYDSSNDEESDNFAFQSDEESEKDVKNGSTTIKARLERDSKAIKNI